MCLRILGFGMSAKGWGPEVEGVEWLALLLLLLGGQGNPELAEARPEICKPVDWGQCWDQNGFCLCREGAPSGAAWGTFLIDWAS